MIVEQFAVMQASAFNIVASDEEDSPFPRWLLSLRDNSCPEGPCCTLSLEWSTRMDGKWGRRSASRKTVHLKSTAKDVNELIGYANKLEMTHPDECLHHHQVHTHGGYSPTRSNDDSTICCYLIPLEKISYGAVLYLKKSSKIWTDTSWGLTLMAMIQPYLVPADWRTKSNSTRRLP